MGGIKRHFLLNVRFALLLGMCAATHTLPALSFSIVCITLKIGFFLWGSEGHVGKTAPVGLNCSYVCCVIFYVCTYVCIQMCCNCTRYRCFLALNLLWRDLSTMNSIPLAFVVNDLLKTKS